MRFDRHTDAMSGNLTSAELFGNLSAKAKSAAEAYQIDMICRIEL
jgi:hypothetical protein